MSFHSIFPTAPAEWLPLKDRALVDRLAQIDLNEYPQGAPDCPGLSMTVCGDVHNYFAADLFYRLVTAASDGRKLVLLLPSPENEVYISLAENLNLFRVDCRRVHVFFLNEYANEKNEAAPWQSPYSRAGHFMRYFYERLDEELRMPLSQIHFWTTENAAHYSELLEAEGGADAAYTSLSRSGGMGAIDTGSFPAETMEEFLQMGSRVVTPMPETIAQDSLRGMFGCSGDIGNVPPRAATVGPKDLIAARERIDLEYLIGHGGMPAYQKFPLRLALYGPVCPQNPACLLRLSPWTVYAAQTVADKGTYRQDRPEMAQIVAKLQKEG
jgi:hypothetical protein